MTLERRIRKYIEDMRKVNCVVVPSVIANDLQEIVNAESHCAWSADGWLHRTSCGESFAIVDGTPIENDMRFCCYCGKALSEVEAA